MKTIALTSVLLLASLASCRTIDCMTNSEPLKAAANQLVNDVSVAALDVPEAKVLVDQIRADFDAKDWEHLAVDAFALGKLIQNNAVVYDDCRNFLRVANEVRIECNGKKLAAGQSAQLSLPPRN